MQGTAATCDICGRTFDGATHMQTAAWADAHQATTGHTITID